MKRVAVSLLAAASLAACSSAESESTPASPSPAVTTTTTTAPENPYADLSARRLGLRLVAAATRGDVEQVRQLVDAGADLETRDSRERTPLLLAVTHDRAAVVRVLVDAGADPDALDERHDTPWLVTGVTGSVSIARILLEAEPDLTIRNRYGGIAHIPASERGHADYVAYVLDHTDIAIDHVNDQGWTALLEAVVLGQGTQRWQRVVETLVAHGADASIPDRNGLTALQHAQRRGFTTIARILERAEPSR